MVEGYVGIAEVMAAEQRWSAQAQVDKEIARKGEVYNDNWRQLKRQLRSIRGRFLLRVGRMRAALATHKKKETVEKTNQLT